MQLHSTRVPTGKRSVVFFLSAIFIIDMRPEEPSARSGSGLEYFRIFPRVPFARTRRAKARQAARDEGARAKMAYIVYHCV